MFEILHVSPCLGALRSDTADPLPSSTRIVAEQETHRDASDRGKIRCGVGLVNRALVLSHLDVESPVQAVLDAPVLPIPSHEGARAELHTD